MKKSSKIVASSLVALSLCAIAGTASATSPVCNGRNARSQATGTIIGKNVARAAWVGSGEDPDNVEQFTQDLADLLLPLVPPFDGLSLFIQCRVQGVIDGIKAEIIEIGEEVGDACFYEGDQWGVLMAPVDCVLAAGPGLIFDLSFPADATAACGAGFERGCDASYEQYVDDNAADCSALTTSGQFSAAQANACTYLF